jgi:hypothetical protein
MLSSALLFAADSPEAAVICGILALVAFVFALVAAFNKSQNAVWKNGLPYCPKCGRQISLKTSRTHCRSCGYNLVQSSAISSPSPPQRPQISSPEAARIRAVEEERRHRGEQERFRLIENDRQRAEQEAAERKAAREAACRAKGVEPGAWARFWVLPTSRRQFSWD